MNLIKPYALHWYSIMSKRNEARQCSSGIKCRHIDHLQIQQQIISAIVQKLDKHISFTTQDNCNTGYWNLSILTVTSCFLYQLSLTNRPRLVAWSSGRALVFGWCAFAVLRSTCSWWVTTYVGMPSAIGQPTRPTQPFILSGSINE